MLCVDICTCCAYEMELEYCIATCVKFAFFLVETYFSFLSFFRLFCSLPPTPSIQILRQHAQPTLQQVQVVFRHGDRSAIQIIPGFENAGWCVNILHPNTSFFSRFSKTHISSFWRLCQHVARRRCTTSWAHTRSETLRIRWMRALTLGHASNVQKLQRTLAPHATR